ncbi:S-type anion channel SLAH1-like [Cynara cardunculus var. scolymus]|uniref:C4-dicarboxylate transporter/malic acid transport protein n=1 Tax=Cynara cardunculus var. scolymus TaxID=59895 RepID=A0A103XMD0_CYNCS|nr:S-type anion channel SLAH1-like [Cynara cardunculus var. scolymus]KVH93134.1 C4-dicarboxylate transporter/malic acid transport protein [Cynara cardunculus var. scolymus]
MQVNPTQEITPPTSLPPSPPPPQLQLEINSITIHQPTNLHHDNILIMLKGIVIPIIARFHAGYFRISLSLCWQTLLWKTLSDPPENAHAYRRMLGVMPSAAFLLLWSLSLFILVSLSILYLLRCALLSNKVKDEYLNHISVNYLFAPWISWLLLLQSTPFVAPKTVYYLFLWWVFVVPIFILDVKIYGQWFTKGKRFLSTVANPASQLTVIGNFVGARTAAQMGWKESAMFMFSLGIVHYVVVFVTLYQRLSGKSCMPVMLRPVMFLFIAAPSMASLAWDSISGTFDCSSKMLFYLALFLFFSLVSRPNLFKKSMKKFDVVWWAYSYPLTLLALASTKYAHEMKSTVAHLLMLILSGLSVLVSCVLMVYTALNTNILLPRDDDDLILMTLKPIIIGNTSSDPLTS